MGEVTGTFDVPESEARVTSPTRRLVNIGLIGGVVLIYLALTGIVERFHTRNVITGATGEGLLQLSRTMLIVALLLTGYLAGRGRKGEPRRGSPVLRGLAAGAISGALLALTVVVLKTLLASGINPREVLIAVSGTLLDTILFGEQGTAVAALIIVGASALIAGLGAAFVLLSRRTRRPVVTALATTLLVSMMEPLLRPIFVGLELPSEWLYSRGGLTVTGAIIVLVLTLGIALALAWRQPEDRQGGAVAPPRGRAQEVSQLDRVTMWLGVSGFVLAVVIVVMNFANAEVIPLFLLFLLLLNVAGLILSVAAGRRARAEGTRPSSQIALAGAAAAAGIFLILPPIAGPFISDVLGTVGLYILLGLGLNIVVGYAGLLDLGYVAFFAVGAYAMAIFTSRASFLVVETGGGVQNLNYAEQGWTTNFWFALPLVVIIAVISGVLIGAPVLRLRGDYLAIVTLGFGEIIRTLVLSDWLAKWLGGAQGIIQIPAIRPPEALNLRDPERIYYVIFIFALVAAWISFRLVESRVGRAWAAMREDESVAEAMGISVIKYKLLAFAMGAGIGCLGGTFFAAKIGSIFPNSFHLLVSINVLAVIVLGGMGSIPGVVVGALVLVGLPELLREFAEYRLLLYGAILVAIMIYKPEGLIPNRRRLQELHVQESEEDQYERGGPAPEPVIVTAEKEEG